MDLSSLILLFMICGGGSPSAHAARVSQPAAENLPAPKNTEAEKASLPWEKIREQDGITVFRREVPGSPVLAFKGEGVVPAPIEKVATIIFDTTRAPEWVVDLAE